MIVSPRAKPVIDILRIEGERFIEIDEVFLYRRAKDGSSYQKIPYWKRGEENSNVDTDGCCCCCKQTPNTGDCVHTPCVIIAEADFDAENLIFDRTVMILDGEGNPTGETIHLDHIIELEGNNDR